jgi:hypothetical protein
MSTESITLSHLSELLEYFILCQVSESRPSHITIASTFAILQKVQGLKHPLVELCTSYACCYDKKVNSTVLQEPSRVMLYQSVEALASYYPSTCEQGIDFRTMLTHIEEAPMQYHISAIQNYFRQKNEQITIAQDIEELESQNRHTHDDMHIREHGFSPRSNFDLQ